jgi:hypothetical protein
MSATIPIHANSHDSHNTSPYWFATVIPFKYRELYDRNAGKSLPNAKEKALETNNPIILTTVMSFECSSSKQNHTSGLTIQLIKNKNYMDAIYPNDWIFFNVFDNKSDYQETLTNVMQGFGINTYESGLKFIGKVQSISESQVRQANGALQATITITANGYTELDNTIYYNERVGLNFKDAPLLLHKFSGDFNKFIRNGSVNSQAAVIAMLNVCLGMGPDDAYKDPANTKALKAAGAERQQSNLILNPNTIMGVPRAVLSLTRPAKDTNVETAGAQPTYIDLLQHIVGLQSFGDQLDSHNLKNAHPEAIKMWPVLLGKTTVGNHYATLQPITGSLTPMPVDFNGKNVWYILDTYLNKPINEMYTCLKPDLEGHIRPTIVTRQIPFTIGEIQEQIEVTSLYANNRGNTDFNFIQTSQENKRMLLNGTATPIPDSAQILQLKRELFRKYANSGEFKFEFRGSTTKFLELPRWLLSPNMVLSLTVGKSEQSKVNWCMITPLSPGKDPVAQAQRAQVESGPAYNEAEVIRSGLRMFDAQVGIATAGNDKYKEEVVYWNKIMADILFSQHLRKTGEITCNGITKPVCEGDNLEFDGTVYHIERVLHRGFISPGGNKQFHTVLGLSNGISINKDLFENKHTTYGGINTVG